MMNDTLMILGTHFIDENVISEYKKMRDTPNVDCLLAVDNEGYKAAFKNRIENRIFFDVSVRCFFFDLKVHDELELPHFVNNGSPKYFGNIMWLNGDYRFYYVKKFFPNYKYYWLIEYDVFCNAPDYSNFLDKFSNNSSDCLITHLRHEPKETSDWCWVQGIDWVYKDCETYGSFLPVVRLSARAVDFLYKRRLEHKEIYVESNKDKWIFCELFVPTELMNGGFSCENIDEPNITGTWYLNDSRFFLKQDGKLYHPIKYVKNKISAMQNQIDDLNLKLRKLFLITLVEKLQKTPAIGKNPLPLQMNEQFTQASLIVNLEQIPGGGVKFPPFIIKSKFLKMQLFSALTAREIFQTLSWRIFPT